MKEFDSPVNVSNIHDEYVRTHIEKNGCCGEKELIKLYAYTLLSYHRVVHLDTDVIILANLDELLDLDHSLVFTTDPNMQGKSKVPPVQGGFLLIRPSMQVYHDLVNVVLNANFVPGR